MKGISTSRAAVVALASLVLGVGAAGASGGSNVSTRLTLKLDRSDAGDVIRGAVRSKAHACEAKRKLRLHHRAVSEAEPSSVIATLRTDGKGKWTYKPKKNVNGDRLAAPGNYHVKVGDVKLGGGITCKAKFSSTLFIG